MVARTLHEMIGRLRGAATAGAGGATDAHLLERFNRSGDQDAFELLLWRHAGAVLGVCRRLLRDERDVEDAFQATFIVLARKAGSVGGESVGGWLYRVAQRVALRARAGAAARAARERPLGGAEPCGGGPGPADEAACSELQAALDEQVERLPAKCREAFVLRCLAGKSAAEAARELGCSPATVESRLALARQRLRERLAAKGFGPEALCGAVPAAWGVSEFGAAALAAAGRAASAGSVSPRAAALAGEVMRAMTMTKLKSAAALVALACAVAGAGGLASRPAGAQARADDRPAQARAQEDRADRDREERERAQKEAASLRGQTEELRRRLADAESKDDLTLKSVPPVVVKTVPAAGTEDVDPKTTEIKVTFSKDMEDETWSWTTLSKESFPKVTGKPKYLKDKRTCVLPVKLEAGKTYAIWVNSEKFDNFKDADGKSAVPYLLVFKTKQK
jgi:RNA polymerase sigma factor (sigma-70 family)